MDEPRNNDFKLDLANRLVYFPLARLLIFSFWFRLIFAGFLLFLATPATPDGGELKCLQH